MKLSTLILIMLMESLFKGILKELKISLCLKKYTFITIKDL